MLYQDLRDEILWFTIDEIENSTDISKMTRALQKSTDKLNDFLISLFEEVNN